MPLRSPRNLFCTLGSTVGALALAASAAAQCPTAMLPGEGYPGASGNVLTSVLWDPDGAGPRAPLLVVGGNFRAIGTQTCLCIATFDPATNTWASLGGGMTGNSPEVAALAVLPNGDLVAAGRFDHAGGIAADNIARWDGTAWSPLGSGLIRTFASPYVSALTVAGSGELVAGGRFDRAGGSLVQDVARWNGTTWSAMSGPSATPQALATLPNGDVVLGGYAGSTTSIARWNGAHWLPLGQIRGDARALAIAANGDLLACGSLGVTGGSSFTVGRWDGTQWSTVPSAHVECYSIASLANGEILLGGAFARITTSVPAISVARWDGGNWHPMGAGLGDNLFGGSSLASVRCLTELPNGSVFAGGTFLNSGNQARSYAALWNGSAWQAMSDQRTPMSAWIHALVPAPNAGFYAATGAGQTAGGVLSSYAAHWDGTTWQALPGLPRINNLTSRCMIEAEGIGLLVGGTNGYDSLLQRWTGTTWVPFGNSVIRLSTLAQLPSGPVVVGSESASPHYLATSTGGAWTALGGDTNGPVACLRRLRNGDLIVGGAFSQAGSVPAVCIARWNGSTWSALGNGLPGGVTAVDELPNGNLVAVSYDPATAGGLVAEWNGTTWTNLGSGMNRRIDAVLALPDGDVLAGGWFTTAGGVPAVGLARWRGGAWHAVPGVEGYVSALAMGSNGEIGVGGTFWAASVGSANFVRLASGCAATVTSTTIACTGPAGPLVSAATSLPWLGSKFRIRTTGYASGSLAAVLTGFQATNQLLSAVHPAGLPGCAVLTSLDAVRFAVPVAGVVEETITIQNSPALLGVTLRHQQLQAGFDAAGSLTSLSTSNLLQSVVGDF